MLADKKFKKDRKVSVICNVDMSFSNAQQLTAFVKRDGFLHIRRHFLSM